MPGRPSCICGKCKKCKHRAYMNDWMERRKDKDYKAKPRLTYIKNPNYVCYDKYKAPIQLSIIELDAKFPHLRDAFKKKGKRE